MKPEEVAEEITKGYFSPMMREDEKPWKYFTEKITAALTARDKQNEERIKEIKEAWLMMLDEMLEKIPSPEWRESWIVTKALLSHSRKD